MLEEVKACQNCHQNFIILPDDFSFYEKMSVPAPTFCPDCRLQRRLAWRNERSLFKRANNAPGSEGSIIISTYPPSLPLVVYDNEYWWSDSWDAMDYGIDYDFSSNFFTQFNILLKSTPLISFFDSKGVNNRYCNYITEGKNNYMLSAIWSCEDCLYSNRNSFCKNCVDQYVCHKNEFSYSNVYCGESNKLFYSEHSYNCVDSYFLYDCRGCTDCFMSYGLRNKSYYIQNVRHTKEEYKEKMSKINLGDYSTILELKKYFKEFKKDAIRKYANNINCVNVTGDNIENAKDVKYSFDLPGEYENVKYCNWGTYGLRDSYDTGPGTGGKSELTYEAVSTGVADSNCAFTTVVWNSRNVQYSFNCYSCNDCFGCVSLRNKSYCIFNKQYTKEEYIELLDKLKKHMDNMPYMDKAGNIYKYGEFFPIEISPYAYNGSTAQDYFTLTKRQSEDLGYFWQDDLDRNYLISIKSNDLPNNINDINSSLLQETIECANANNNLYCCTKAYKLIPEEFDFYKRMNLPIPRLCPNCRHVERISERNPMKLWHRNCMCDKLNHHHGEGKCDVEFETSYAPNRPEKVYCEKCYQQEVL